MTRKLLSMLGLLAAVAGALILTATPASAHAGRITVYASDGTNAIAVGRLSSSHTSITTCDEELDGKGVITEFVREGGQSGHVVDANGGNSGCTAQTVGSASNQVIRIRVCVATACTGWQRHTPV